MIPLIIISAIVLLIVLLLFLPISLDIMYTDDFFMTVRFAGIRIFKIEPGQDIKKPKSDAESDKKAEKQAENPFKKLNREKGITIVLITHFMEEAAAADRVIVMDHGQITADGSPTEIFADSETLQRAGLALPQTSQLLRGLREKGFAVNTGLISPEDTAREIFRVVAGGEMA